jgi:hypothetical protein
MSDAMTKDQANELAARSQGFVLDSKHGPIVVRPPTRDEWKRHLGLLAQGARAEAEDQIFEACAIHPPPAELATILDVSPGLPTRSITQLHALAGGECGAPSKDENTIPEDVRARLALENPRGICYIHTPRGTVAFTTMDRTQRKKYLREIANASERGELLEWLAIACVKYPTRAEFIGYLDTHPGIPSGAREDIIGLGDGSAKLEGEGSRA